MRKEIMFCDICEREIGTSKRKNIRVHLVANGKSVFGALELCEKCLDKAVNRFCAPILKKDKYFLEKRKESKPEIEEAKPEGEEKNNPEGLQEREEKNDG